MSAIRFRITVLSAVAALTATGAVAAAGTASASGVPRCGNGSLAVTRTQVQRGTSRSWLRLVYRNTTEQTCTVDGYPGLDAVSSTGRVLAHATRTQSSYAGGGRLARVTVAGGGYASAGVEWRNAGGSSCRSASHVETIVAGTSRAHRLTVAVSACRLQVHPTVAGTAPFPAFGPAQRYWLEGSHAISADVNSYLGRAEAALRTHPMYRRQVAELAELISYPETGLTPTQITRAQADVKALDAFFATPGLYA